VGHRTDTAARPKLGGRNCGRADGLCVEQHGACHAVDLDIGRRRWDPWSLLSGLVGEGCSYF
jgi:hypothetical protein